MLKQLVIRADDVVFKYIIGKIIAHEIRPGTKLYETDLVDQLNISRTPIVQAIKKLLALGILEKEQGTKGYVLPILTRYDFINVFLIRQALEGMAAYQAALKRTNADLEKFHCLQKAHEKYLKTYTREAHLKIAEINEQIHRSIVDASKNIYIIRAFEPLFWRSSLYTFNYSPYYVNFAVSAEYKPESYVEHQHIFDAIEASNPLVARHWAEVHIINTQNKRIARGDLSSLSEN